MVFATHGYGIGQGRNSRSNKPKAVSDDRSDRPVVENFLIHHWQVTIQGYEFSALSGMTKTQIKLKLKYKYY